MNTYQKKLIKEHSELVVKVNTLHNYIYGNESNEDCKIEFAIKCIQLAAMKKYEEALRARLENANVIYENGDYLERVATVTENMKGNDYDKDEDDF